MLGTDWIVANCLFMTDVEELTGAKPSDYGKIAIRKSEVIAFNESSIDNHTIVRLTNGIEFCIACDFNKVLTEFELTVNINDLN